MPEPFDQCTGNIPARWYCRVDTRVLFGVLFWELQQAELAGACYSFGATLCLQFGKDPQIMPLNRT